MQKVKFYDCVDIVGKVPKNFSGEKIYVSTGALDKNYIDFSQIEKINFASRPSRANLEVKADNIIFAKMYQTDKTLLIDEEKENYIYSTGFFAIRPKQQKITTKCLMYLIQSDEFIKQKDKYCSGATQKAITNEGLKKIEINIPPIEEQKEIAERLDKVSELIEKRKEQIKKLDLLIKSRFLEMFGDLENNKFNWNKCKLADVAIKITDGEHGTVPRVSMNEGVLYFMARNITKEGEIDLKEVSYVPHNIHSKIYKRCNPEYNDLLIVCVGATIGKSALVPNDIGEFSIARSVALIKPNKQKINSLFLLNVIKSDVIQKNIWICAHAAAQSGLYTNMINNIEIFLPPLNLQNEFAEFVEKTDKLKQTIKNNLEKLEILKKSLMQQYFG